MSGIRRGPLGMAYMTPSKTIDAYGFRRRCPKCGYEHNVDDPDTCPNYDDE